MGSESSEGAEYAPTQRNQKVEKRQKENEPTRFYHVSNKRFKVGTVIRPMAENTFVSITDSPIPHYTIAKEKVDPYIDAKHLQRRKQKWYVYEVDPVGPISFDPEFDHFICDRARVVKFVGDANSILKRSAPHREHHRYLIGGKSLGTHQVKTGYETLKKRGPKSYWAHIQRVEEIQEKG